MIFVNNLIRKISLKFNIKEKVEVRIARIFNTFGPRMNLNDGRVVSNFILQSLQNQSITVTNIACLILGQLVLVKL